LNFTDAFWGTFGSIRYVYGQHVNYFSCVLFVILTIMLCYMIEFLIKKYKVCVI